MSDRILRWTSHSLWCPGKGVFSGGLACWREGGKEGRNEGRGGVGAGGRGAFTNQESVEHGNDRRSQSSNDASQRLDLSSQAEDTERTGSGEIFETLEVHGIYERDRNDDKVKDVPSVLDKREEPVYVHVDANVNHKVQGKEEVEDGQILSNSPAPLLLAVLHALGTGLWQGLDLRFVHDQDEVDDDCHRQ